MVAWSRPLLENSLAGVGAMLVQSQDPDRGDRLQYSLFDDAGGRFEIDQVTVGSWKESGIRQVIGQAEILPVLVSKVTWKAKLENRKCLCFIDNDSAMEALIRGFSPSLAS
jgi:hypothetical protein